MREEIIQILAELQHGFRDSDIETIADRIQSAAHARSEAVGVKDASYTEMLIDNAACASQCDFDAVTREAIRLNIIDPLLGMYGEYTPATVGTGAALADPAVPEGMVLVPREPTEAMLQAACDATFGPAMRTHEENHRLGWRAMIAAAEKEAR